jgi:hypothetical protein
MEKGIRSILNKVSEGNIELMFNNLMELIDSMNFKQLETKTQQKQLTLFAQAYSKIFMQMNIQN